MAGKTDRTGVQYAFKKLSGRANTSNIKSDAQEVIGSNIQVGTQTIFGQDVPLSASRIDFTIYSASNGGAATAECVVFTVSVITGTTYDADSATGGGGDGSQSAGPHGYKLVMTGNYTSLSSNTKKGTYPFTDGTLVHETLGKLQIIPPNFSQESPNPYILKIYEADGSDANQIGDEIPLLDEVDWTFDAYNGILFLQDYDSGKIPAFARGFIYVGDYLSASLGNAGGADTEVQFNNAGALTGTANFTFNKTTDALKVTNLSGSLTHLSDGTSYLVAGTNVTITSATNGQVTIASSGGGSSDGGPIFFDSTTAGSIFTTGSTAFVGGQSSPAAPDAASDIGTDVFFFVSGTIDSKDTANTGSAVFGGDVVVSGALNAPFGLSGSLTRLTDGSSYLIAGSNVTITSSSNGAVTIASSGGGSSDGTNFFTSPAAGKINTTGSAVFAGGELGTSYVATTIGTDVFFFVSGTIDSKDTSSTGSAVFGGDVVVSGALNAPFGLSGSLTRLTDGTSYLSAGSNVTITSSSNGQVVIASTATGGGSGVGWTSPAAGKLNATGSIAAAGGELGTSYVATNIGTDVFFFVSGTIDSKDTANTGSAVFGGDLLVSGTVNAPRGLSGSLTRLTDGTSYLSAGTNVTITSASNGQITINSPAGEPSGDANAHYVVTEATGSLANYKLIEAGTGITLTTGSNSLTIASDLSAIEGRDKKRYTVTSSHPAESPFVTPLSNFSLVLDDPDLIDVYLNGMLTVSGTSAQVSSAAVDYTVFSSGSLSFAFDLIDEDVVDVVLSQLDPSAGESDPAASYLVLSTTGSLSNERLFTAGVGLSSTDNGAGNTFVVDVNDSVIATLTGSVFSGGVSVQGAFTASLGVGTLATNSSVVHISASNAPSSGSVLVAKSSTEASWQQAIVFGEQPTGTKNGTNLSFNLDGAPINNTDLMLFVNGLLQLSGAIYDYTLTGSEINFNSGLAPISEDMLTAIYRPSA